MVNWTERPTTDLIVIHSSDTNPRLDIGVDEMRRLHTKQGYLDVGYHFVITRTGGVEEGRPRYARGAHLNGKDDVSVGICLIGRGGKFTEAQLSSLYDLLENELLSLYDNAQVRGHNEDCPGFDVAAWLVQHGLEDYVYESGADDAAE